MQAHPTGTRCESAPAPCSVCHWLNYHRTIRRVNTNSGNQMTMNNNGGGNNFSGMNFSGMNRCRRAFFDKRSELHAEHEQVMEELVLAKRGGWGGNGHPHHPHHAPPPAPRGSGGGGGAPRGGNRPPAPAPPRGRGGGGGWSNVSTSRVVHNNVQQNNNQGVVAGSGVVCKRETDELALERRELAAGHKALESIGGLQVRSIEPAMEILATRDLGRAALALQTTTLVKRTLEPQPAALLRRDLSDVLQSRAQALGFRV